jgi:hypothetical protein
MGTTRDEARAGIGYLGVRYPVTEATYQEKVRAFFADDADKVLAEYPSSDYTGPSYALSHRRPKGWWSPIPQWSHREPIPPPPNRSKPPTAGGGNSAMDGTQPRYARPFATDPAADTRRPDQRQFRLIALFAITACKQAIRPCASPQVARTY